MRDVIYISKNTLNNEQLSHEAFCLLVALNGLVYKNGSNYCMSYNSIEYYLFGRRGTSREREKVINGIKNLISLGYISIVERFSSYEAVYDVTKVITDINKEYYVSITKDELHKIMNIKTQKDKYRIFRFFVFLIGTFNSKNKSKVGFLTQEYMSKEFGINIDTFREYNKILEENKLIYVIRHTGDFKKSTDLNGITNIRGVSNTYSRYVDRKLCEEYAQSVKSNKNYTSRKAASNLSRSIKQKYNAMLKGKEYPADVVVEIYKYIKALNQKKMDSGSSDLLDMSIFEKYRLVD